MEARPRALVVEDDQDIREMLGEWLGERLAVTLAEDGAQALELVARDRQKFNVIVLDLELPRLSGTAFVQELRKQHIDVPVVIVSGAEDARSHARAVHAAFIPKPFDVRRLQEKIEQLLDTGS
jgi:DNA-binding response OmpR family regulator